MASKTTSLPPLVPYPQASWRSHMLPEEWEACLDAWISLAEAHLSLPTPDFTRISTKDDSLPIFLKSYFAETASSHDGSSTDNLSKTKQLRKQAYILYHRLLNAEKVSDVFVQWEVLADFSKVYGKEKASKVIILAWDKHGPATESSLGGIKNLLIKELDAGLKGDLKNAEANLKRLNHLLHTSPDAAAFFMAGDDFVDALISCYKLMNPPLRKVIITTTYLCIIGLTEGPKPKFSSLVDQLYSLKAAAEAHKKGPTNVNDSMVAELVTVTPILKQIQQRIDASGSGSSRAKSVITSLQGFIKPGGSNRPPRSMKKKVNKGKGPANADGNVDRNVHVHQMSLISQVQDLFPDLGSGFIVKLLDAYNDNAEEVIAHLLDDSLPADLANADRSEEMALPQEQHHADLAPHSTPPQLPTRRNVFDDDELDQLAVDASRLHFGRRNPDKTADDVLKDRSTAPNKAAILSALAAFDSDDDERDDTYDVADVGGTVDSTNPEDPSPENTADAQNPNEETLFRTYKSSPNLFGRDAATRRSKERETLRQQTGMTDEGLEGWALMLSRDSRQMRRLEAKFSTFRGEQVGLESTAWRASPAASGDESEDVAGGSGGMNRGRGGGYRGRGRGGRGGRGGGRGGGNVAGTSGEKETDVARQRKEANKGSRANHNRRDQRARKMARGGFPG
ncbi:CUE domain-containing protein [Rutstroemia sp. NJR-2017a BBW]|nr:CUE domain-containing protein [Rutstroemia sp. NJR-2017a BBW]